MELTLDVSGRAVLVVGDAHAARRVLRRYRTLGAHIAHIDAPHTYTVCTDTAHSGLHISTAHADTAHTVAHIDTNLEAALDAAELVVSVGLSDADTERLAASCRARRLWHSVEAPAAFSRGSVTLVGGGPGRRDLLTVGALDALRDADVVFFDRLAPHDELAELAPGAELVDVGKTPGHHPVAQCDIEALMVERALGGADVVRLKGGDPYVFGRGGEEVVACRAAGVPVRVIPGVTSAISVPAAAGIPVTQREVSHAFTVISGHAPLTERELASLAGLGGTIVVLMGVATLPHLSAGLARHGMGADMPMAIIEQGYSSAQRTTVATLDSIVSTAMAIGATSPAVIVIGEVVRLATDDDSRARMLACVDGVAGGHASVDRAGVGESAGVEGATALSRAW
ncbi:uroporphyrinogen-III C-methyltransferase [Planctomonas psychrotolerans]|uniref:uroporphyrinogen-III C-methyltransferase n=1 Tax=Planctomonas psychrotolerans TaxID=2528712 RepID=UPI00123C6958|nr:uroporphyrinogen-III C-methyltransferase [Planctomonas psychrotolerans]